MAEVTGNKSPFVQQRTEIQTTSVSSRIAQLQSLSLSEKDKGKMPSTPETKGHTASALAKTQQETTQGTMPSKVQEQKYLGTATKASVILPKQEARTSPPPRPPRKASSPPPAVLRTAPQAVKDPKNAQPSIDAEIAKEQPALPSKPPSTPPPPVPKRNLSSQENSSIGRPAPQTPLPPVPTKSQSQEISGPSPAPISQSQPLAASAPSKGGIPSEKMEVANPNFQKAIKDTSMREVLINEEKLRDVANQAISEKKSVYYSPQEGLVALKKQEAAGKGEYTLMPIPVLRNLIQQSNIEDKNELLNKIKSPNLLSKLQSNKSRAAKFKKTQRSFYDKVLISNIGEEVSRVGITFSKRNLAIKEFTEKGTGIPFIDRQNLNKNKAATETRETSMREIIKSSKPNDVRMEAMQKENSAMQVICDSCNSTLSGSQAEVIIQIKNSGIDEKEKTRLIGIIDENYSVLKKYTQDRTEFIQDKSPVEIQNAISTAITNIMNAWNIVKRNK